MNFFSGSYEIQITKRSGSTQETQMRFREENFILYIYIISSYTSNPCELKRINLYGLPKKKSTSQTKG